MATEWVLWGLESTDRARMPMELFRGSHEGCTQVQPYWREQGFVTGPYREGFEPLGLLKIRSDYLLDNRRQTADDGAMTSQRESTNRAIKATAIVAVLDRYIITPSDVEALDDAGWQAAAQLAGRLNGKDWTDASEDTRKTVVAVLRQREATPDPFQEFPK